MRFSRIGHIREIENIRNKCDDLNLQKCLKEDSKK